MKTSGSKVKQSGCFQKAKNGSLEFDPIQGSQFPLVIRGKRKKKSYNLFFIYNF